MTFCEGVTMKVRFLRAQLQTILGEFLKGPNSTENAEGHAKIDGPMVYFYLNGSYVSMYGTILEPGECNVNIDYVLKRLFQSEGTYVTLSTQEDLVFE